MSYQRSCLYNDLSVDDNDGDGYKSFFVFFFYGFASACFCPEEVSEDRQNAKPVRLTGAELTIKLSERN